MSYKTETVRLSGLKLKDSDYPDQNLDIAIIIFGTILIFLIKIYGLSSCDKVSLEIDEKTMNVGQFMDYYTEKCLKEKDLTKINITDLATSSVYSISLDEDQTTPHKG